MIGCTPEFMHQAAGHKSSCYNCYVAPKFIANGFTMQ